MPDSPTWGVQAFTFAIGTWNQAQTWFLESYYPQDYLQDVFTLKLATSSETPQITVQYVSSIPNTPKGVNGLTDEYGARISIILGPGPYPVSPVLAEIELGHSLGLADNPNPYYTNGYTDLMYFNPNNINAGGLSHDYPSTLDLFAVYREAKCLCYAQGDSVVLQNQIPYVVWKPNLAILPEFSNSIPVLFLAISSVALMTRARKLRY